jgi:predicted phosphoribosyltransferase
MSLIQPKKPGYFHLKFPVMVHSIQNTLLQSREEAGLILGSKLKEYKNTNAVVVGIPCSGVSVAAAMANYLSLPLDVMTCRRIKHPANENKNLGSVCLTEVYIPYCNGNNDSIPQDFIAHQVALLKHANLFEYNFYHDRNLPISLRYKTVIVVDDMLRSGETILVCLHEIRKQKPLKIIVAVPIVGAEAARMVSAEVDDTVFLKMEHEVAPTKNYFMDYHKMDKHQVKGLLEMAKKSLSISR